MNLFSLRPSGRRLILAGTLAVVAFLTFFLSAMCPRCTQEGIASGTCHCTFGLEGPVWIIVPGLVVAAYLVACGLDTVWRRRRGSRAA